MVALHPQVFWPGQTRPVFYVASRGHHADIGGITPGSMPPHSTTLQQEGAVFLSFKLVQGGVFQEEGEWEWACSDLEVGGGGSVDQADWGAVAASEWRRPALRLAEPGGDPRVVADHLSEMTGGTEVGSFWAQEGSMVLGVGSWPGQSQDWAQEGEGLFQGQQLFTVVSALCLHWVCGLQSSEDGGQGLQTRGELSWACTGLPYTMKAPSACAE